MHLSILIGAAVALQSGTTAAAPLSAVEMGSKHSVYLSTCTSRSVIPGCPLIIICPSNSTASAAQTFTAAAYFANTPANGNLNNPTEIATVSETGAPWEGEKRAARFRNGAPFSSSIDAGAATLAKSEIAGTALMGSEEFVCFKDGASKFSVGGGLLGRDRAACVADYWCGSVGA
ncbi:hypothetical protein K458DRAFT_415987 [Lentithecium fluviatile CBS 122367]|uniref:Uncharacterized protein n=1 Tax=Lentithecium fluviatile CBS 122367 TaxID=1168545 RepID=A0A6G1J918_9PLEO|nr:hypothetical protein K458DRAFT_415987 [Lentithecium fluviatile CBS 122367]